MTAEQRELVERPITSEEEALQWMRELIQLEMFWHLDDDPRDILWEFPVSDREAWLLLARWAELWAHLGNLWESLYVTRVGAPVVVDRPERED